MTDFPIRIVISGGSAAQRDIDRLAPGVAQIINAVVAEGDNMALPGRSTPDDVRARVERGAGE